MSSESVPPPPPTSTSNGISAGPPKTAQKPNYTLKYTLTGTLKKLEYSHYLYQAQVHIKYHIICRDVGAACHATDSDINSYIYYMKHIVGGIAGCFRSQVVIYRTWSLQ